MTTRIFLIRHGETDWNVQNRIQGQLGDAKLTEKGKQQAVLLRKELTDIMFDMVFSSPLRRALETAKTVFPDSEIIIDDRLKERGFGKLEGLTRDEVRQKYPEIQKVKDEIGTTPWFKGSERLEDLANRGVGFLESVARENEGKTMAVFTHGGIMEATMALLHGVPMMDKEQFKHDPCAYSILEYENGKLTVKVLNHNAHLEGK